MTEKRKDSKFLRRFREISLSSVPKVKLSTNLITALIIFASIFILGGGIYILLEKPTAFLPLSTGYIFFYPGLTEQTITESLYFIFFLTMGISGGLIALLGSRNIYSQREAKMVLTVGFLMLGLALFGCEWSLSVKF